MDKLLPDYPKFLGMTDDLHAMATYLNDLRLITFVLTATGYACGIIFLLVKLFQWCSGGSADRKRKESAGDADVERSAFRYQLPPNITMIKPENGKHPLSNVSQQIPFGYCQKSLNEVDGNGFTEKFQ